MPVNDGLESGKLAVPVTGREPVLESDYCAQWSESLRAELSKGMPKLSHTGDLCPLSSNSSTLELSLIREALKARPQFSTEAFSSRLKQLADDLQTQAREIQRDFSEEHSGQGPIGRAFDTAKNRVGVTGKGDLQTTPGWLWAQIFDRSRGSQACREALDSAVKKIDELRLAAADHDLVKFGSIYRSLTGKEFDQNSTVAADRIQVRADVEAYRQSQQNGVEFISDLAAVAASIGALRLGQGTPVTASIYARLGTGFSTAAAAKGLLKRVDEKYASLPVDLLSGGINGLAFPVAQKAGLSFEGAAFKHGLGVAAGVENACRSTLLELKNGRHVDGYKLVSDAITGYGIGYASAIALMGSISALSGGFGPGSAGLPGVELGAKYGSGSATGRFR